MATLSRSTARIRTLIVTVVLVVSACGGSGSDEVGTVATTSTNTPAVVSSTMVTTPATSVPTTAGATPDTTAAPAVQASPVIALDDIPALVEEWGRGDDDPLDLARRIIGFPADIGVPDGATPFELSLDVSTADSKEPWSWEWTYSAVSPVGDIDPDSEDGGPAAVEAASIYDPLMQSLGWHRAARVISSPGTSADSPRSVNFAYKPDFEVLTAGSIEATPVVARVWAGQDIDFASGPDRSGYRIDLKATMESGLVPAAIPAALLGELPVVAGAALSDVRFRSARPPGSLGSDDAPRLLDLEFSIDLPVGSSDAAREAYSNGLGGSAYQMGEPSFLNEGAVQEVTATVYENTWTQRVIVLDRYVGYIEVVSDPDTGSVTARVKIGLEPNRTVLAPS